MKYFARTKDYHWLKKWRSRWFDGWGLDGDGQSAYPFDTIEEAQKVGASYGAHVVVEAVKPWRILA